MKPLSGKDLVEPSAATHATAWLQPAATPALAAAGPDAGARRRQTDCGDLGIRIARDGTWSYHGSPISRKPLVKLFSTVLTRDEQGVFWLATPVERGRITVEDAPFTAVGLSIEGEGRDQIITLVTNVDDHIVVNATHPVVVRARDGQPAPYVLVRNGLEALIVRAVYYELVGLAVEYPVGEAVHLGVWSAGRLFDLGRAY